MRLHLPKHLLLILTLVLGQWLAVAHAHEHPAPAVDQVCQICLHAPGLDTGALAGKPAALPSPARSEAPAVESVVATTAAPLSVTRIRGPPVTQV